MKTIKTIIACGLVIISNLNGMSQSESITIKGKETFLVKDPALKITSFTCSNVNGKIVLSWIVEDQKCNGTYMIYRSVDGENFEIIGIKQSMIVPKKKESTYFFNDDSSTASDELHYKIYYFGVDNHCYSSSVLTIR